MCLIQLYYISNINIVSINITISSSSTRLRLPVHSGFELFKVFKQFPGDVLNFARVISIYVTVLNITCLRVECLTGQEMMLILRLIASKATRG